MIPYTTPQKAGASLDSVLAASEFIDEYCQQDGYTLANIWETLHLPTQNLYSPANGEPSQLVVMLPKRPLWLANLKVPDTATITGIRLTDRDYRIVTMTVEDAHPYRVTLQALWGWNIPDRTGLRTWDVTEVFDGDINESDTLTTAIQNNFEIGDVLNIYDPNTLYNEYAYVTGDNTVQRFAHLTGIVMLDPLTTNGRVEKLSLPQDLQFATGVVARRMEQLQRTPGYHGSDNNQMTALIHNVAKTINQYRNIY